MLVATSALSSGTTYGYFCCKYAITIPKIFQDKKKRKKYHDFDSAGGDRLNAGDFKAADDTHIRAWPGFGSNSRHARGSYDSLADREPSPSAGAAPIKHMTV